MSKAKYTVTVKHNESGIESTIDAWGASEADAMRSLENYLYRTAQRNFTVLSAEEDSSENR